MTLRRRLSRHPGWDKVVAAWLIIVWLLLASADTYAPWFPLTVFLWVGQAWSLRWLWNQYVEHTRPTEDKPAVPVVAQAPIPWLVRLMLLPGMGAIVGAGNVYKARHLYRLRQDQRRNPDLYLKVRRELAKSWGYEDAGQAPPERDPMERRLILGNAATWPEGSWPRRWLEGMERWAEANPGQCSTTMHLFHFGTDTCHCGKWGWSELPDVVL